MTVLGTLTALLLIYRVLINLPGTDELSTRSSGRSSGVLCTIGIAIGGLRVDASRSGRTPVDTV